VTPLLAQRLRTDRSFERLYRRYVGDVYHYALAVSRNGPDAEDITQTTFLNAYRAVQRGEEPRAPKNWLLAIAHNVMRQRFRQAARRPNEVELDDAIGATVPDDEGYSAEDIRRGLGQLAFNQRAALVMRELEGRSYAEIAEILGVSVGAVETLIFRARRALREQLETSITCHEAERSISLQLDGRLSRAEKGALRAHLRTCKECATFARSQRAQRAALKGLAAIPLPASLTSLFGGGGAAAGGAVATKAAAVTAAGLLVAGGSVETARQLRSHHAQPVAAHAQRAAQPEAERNVPRAVRDAILSTALPLRRDRPNVSRLDRKLSPAKAAVSKSRGVERRADPSPPVRAHGSAGAPGQLKPKPQPITPVRAKALNPQRGSAKTRVRPPRAKTQALPRSARQKEEARAQNAPSARDKPKTPAAKEKSKQHGKTQASAPVPDEGAGRPIKPPRTAAP
jgi:RNA polymerase sigma-70 factor, ECF subfamily